MAKTLDKSKVEQAFKQAAKTLASGDKDARAGRFVKRGSNSSRLGIPRDKGSARPKS